MFVRIFLVIMLLSATSCTYFENSTFNNSNKKSEVTKNDTVLVVGATGRTGKWIVKQLVDNNIKVKAMVRSEQRGREVLGDEVDLVVGDITDKETMREAFSKSNAVVNAAGAGIKGKGKAMPEWIDYKGTVHLVELAKEYDTKKIVLISSMSVTQEDHFLNRIANNVLKWKFKGEESLRNSGLNYSIIRPGGLVDKTGPEQKIQFFQGGNQTSGMIRRTDVARVAVAALFSDEADRKTYEISAVDGPSNTSLIEDFSKLIKD